MEPESIETRLRRLEDREEIRQLLIEYGRTLDRRDFEAFSKLFARDAEYTGGGGTGAIKGPEAIGKFLEEHGSKMHDSSRHAIKAVRIGFGVIWIPSRQLLHSTLRVLMAPSPADRKINPAFGDTFLIGPIAGSGNPVLCQAIVINNLKVF